MKGTLIIALSMASFLLFACVKESGVSMGVRSAEDNLELVIYPSGGGASGYRLLKEGDRYKAMLTKIAFENSVVTLGDVISERTMVLSKTQTLHVNGLINELANREKYIEKSLVLDAWVFVIQLNNKKVVEFYGWPSKKVPAHIRELTEYLLHVSPIGINLEHSA